MIFPAKFSELGLDERDFNKTRSKEEVDKTYFRLKVYLKVSELNIKWVNLKPCTNKPSNNPNKSI